MWQMNSGWGKINTEEFLSYLFQWFCLMASKRVWKLTFFVWYTMRHFGHLPLTNFMKLGMNMWVSVYMSRIRGYFWNVSVKEFLFLKIGKNSVLTTAHGKYFRWADLFFPVEDIAKEVAFLSEFCSFSYLFELFIPVMANFLLYKHGLVEPAYMCKLLRLLL